MSRKLILKFDGVVRTAEERLIMRQNRNEMRKTAEEITKDLRDADERLSKDGYKAWCYARLAISEAIKFVENREEYASARLEEENELKEETIRDAWKAGRDYGIEAGLGYKPDYINVETLDENDYAATVIPPKQQQG